MQRQLMFVMFYSSSAFVSDRYFNGQNFLQFQEESLIDDSLLQDDDDEDDDNESRSWRR